MTAKQQPCLAAFTIKLPRRLARAGQIPAYRLGRLGHNPIALVRQSAKRERIQTFLMLKN